MKNILDKILLSDNVVSQFYENYNNPKFKAWLVSILPEIEDCRNQNQDTPWHIYNCLDHILHSVEEINKLSKPFSPKTRKILAYCMFFHDIGKPKCHIRRYSKIHERYVDSFPNHNKASLEVTQRALHHFDFNHHEQEIIKLLVYEHDVFFLIKLSEDNDKSTRVLTNELIKELVKKYDAVDDGYKLLEYLILIGKADNLSQNTKLTHPTRHLIDVMENMLNNII